MNKFTPIMSHIPSRPHYEPADIIAAVEEAAQHEDRDYAEGGVTSEQVVDHLDGFDLAQSTLDSHLRTLAKRGDIAKVDGIDPQTMLPRQSFLPCEEVQTKEERYVERP